ncbi:unnamed protein product [Spirodela intermedia]|uniref:Uncharacterized protein n=2 Tax=Spirodela intermedia TaxID=51605 RepID=A0A7I8KN32_SPIIN|nr:unnamed protein product [Spirodela intermedia]CAA6662810.1 unnamed protein product [Spirodela intermedia]CAA7399223.1 unnamed protein product [Spirodela intermedia]
MEARTPPTERWPLSWTIPSLAASSINFFSRSDLSRVKGTFISDLTDSSTGQTIPALWAFFFSTSFSPPCSSRSDSAFLITPSNSFPRWLISMMLIPLPR